MVRKENKKLPKMVVIVGPTASGKTSWSLKLAKKHDGEIISADSRQIYKRMNIGTAKPEGEWKRNGLRRTYFIEEIPHHLIDFLDPGRKFSVAEFRDKALKYSKLIRRLGKVPFLVGGTGLYTQSIVDNLKMPRVVPNKKLRSSFEERTNEELLKLLYSMDPGAKDFIDPKNKRRIVRALEVSILSGKPFSEQRRQGESLFNIIQIGLDIDREVLFDRIDRRIDEMIKMGLVEEVRNLTHRYPWYLSSMSGIGYRQFRGYFEGKETVDDAIKQLEKDTRRYARRQMTWFKRDRRIEWCKTYEEAEKLVDDFLSSSD